MTDSVSDPSAPVGAREVSEFYLPDGTWSCVRDHRTTPCGDCDGCRYIQSVNRVNRPPTPSAPEEEHDHAATPRSPGACELCWEQAFNRAFLLGGSQVDHYRRLLTENEGKSGHV